MDQIKKQNQKKNNPKEDKGKGKKKSGKGKIKSIKYSGNGIIINTCVQNALVKIKIVT